MPLTAKTILAGNFTFAIDGQLQNTVFKIRNIQQEVPVSESRSGDAKYIQKQPGRVEPLTLEIQKISSGSDEIVKWRSLVKDTGEPQRCTMAIGLLDRTGKPVGEFSFHEAYPVSWKLSPLSSMQSGHAIETLTIVAERFDYKAS
jgi:phage tail-like protein